MISSLGVSNGNRGFFVSICFMQPLLLFANTEALHRWDGSSSPGVITAG
jgi:hypothetical protein